ncbi:MAG: zinc ribbon domain-containing protein [Clostridia bacterium]|nr:zinc ribbon domain-containing protein [Clostridia bacterium]
MAENVKNEFGEEESKVSTESIKCPSCGSNMKFDPESQMLYCEHCGTKSSFNQELKASELDLLSGFNADDNQWKKEDVTVFRCDNCGAKVVLSASETAKSCPFCGTAHVEKIDELAGIKPNGVVPFLLTSDKAVERSKTWAKKRLFAPSKFKKSLNAENVKGVYSPCFTFDSKTTSYYRGRIGKNYTRTVGSGKDQHTETYTVWKDISGTYYDNFDDVLISAGNKISQKTFDKISPYDTNESKGYQENYLLGFMAYHYDKSIEDCWGLAKDKMDAAIRKGILSQYSYDEVDYLNVSTTHEAVTYKYVMLPVYVGNFSYKKKVYNFYVNGVSGKTTGKTPVSFWRVLAAVGLGLVVLAGIGLLVYHLVNS